VNIQLKFNTLPLESRIVKVPEDLNIRDSRNNTPLMNALLQRKIERARLLIEKGADLYAQGMHERTPFMVICCDKMVELYPYLDHQKINPNIRDIWGTTQFMYACQSGNLELVQRLLDHHSSEIDINATTIHYHTALHYAAIAPQSKIVEELVRRGANTQVQNIIGAKPVHIAAYFHDQEMLDQLLPFEIHPLLADAFIAEKLLCHRFGIKCRFLSKTDRKIEMEGLKNEVSYSALLQSIKAFLVEQSPKIDGLDWDKVIHFLSNASPDFLNQKSVQSALIDDSVKTAALYCGCHEHSVSVVYVKSDPPLLIKCNRGWYEGFKGLCVYIVKNKSAVPEAFAKFSELSHLPEEKAFFSEEVNELLKLEEKTEWHMPHKKQKAGTCAWASAKLTFRAVLFAELLICGKYSIEEAQKLSYAIYKKWSKDDRNRAVKEFLILIDAIERDKAKIKQKCKDLFLSFSETMEQEGYIPNKILNKVIEKCVDDTLLDAFKLLIKYQHKNFEIKWRAILDRAFSNGHLEILKVLQQEMPGGFLPRDLCFPKTLTGNKHERIKALVNIPGIQKIKDPDDHRNLLHWACEADNFDLAQLLVESGQFDLDAKDKGGLKALHLACLFAETKLVQLLLEKTKNPDEICAGKTLLEWALQSRNEKTLELIINQRNVEINQTDEFGNPLLFIALEFSNPNITAILLNVPGINLNVTNKNGETLLGYVSKHGKVKHAQIILNVRPNLNQLDIFRRTPLMWACRFGQIEIVKLMLKQQGLDLTVKDKDGHAASWYARQSGNSELIKLMMG
jgi:ankyrin repeat protein